MLTKEKMIEIADKVELSLFEMDEFMKKYSDIAFNNSCVMFNNITTYSCLKHNGLYSSKRIVNKYAKPTYNNFLMEDAYDVNDIKNMFFNKDFIENELKASNSTKNIFKRYKERVQIVCVNDHVYFFGEKYANVFRNFAIPAIKMEYDYFDYDEIKCHMYITDGAYFKISGDEIYYCDEDFIELIGYEL